jgi:hypothetical protein
MRLRPMWIHRFERTVGYVVAHPTPQLELHVGRVQIAQIIQLPTNERTVLHWIARVGCSRIPHHADLLDAKTELWMQGAATAAIPQRLA